MVHVLLVHRSHSLSHLFCSKEVPSKFVSGPIVVPVLCLLKRGYISLTLSHITQKVIMCRLFIHVPCDAANLMFQVLASIIFVFVCLCCASVTFIFVFFQVSSVRLLQSLCLFSFPDKLPNGVTVLGSSLTPRINSSKTFFSSGSFVLLHLLRRCGRGGSWFPPASFASSVFPICSLPFSFLLSYFFQWVSLSESSTIVQSSPFFDSWTAMCPSEHNKPHLQDEEDLLTVRFVNPYPQGHSLTPQLRPVCLVSVFEGSSHQFSIHVMS